MSKLNNVVKNLYGYMYRKIVPASIHDLRERSYWKNRHSSFDDNHIDVYASSLGSPNRKKLLELIVDLIGDVGSSDKAFRIMEFGCHVGPNLNCSQTTLEAKFNFLE